MAIRIRKRIDSETLHLPELRHLIGKVVDITVEEEVQSSDSNNDFWNPLSLDEIRRRQGFDASKPPPPVEDLYGSFTAEDFEGFDEWLEEIRRRPWRAGSEDV